MSREGDDRPREGSAAAAKINKLMKKLEDTENMLIVKRRHFEKENKPGTTRAVAMLLYRPMRVECLSNLLYVIAAVEVLKEHLGLIARAKLKWRAYSSSE
jgi:hypothetical protein